VILALWASLATAAPSPSTPVTLMGAYGGTVGPPSLGAGVCGRLIASPWEKEPVGIVFGAREGWVTDDSRSLGAIAVGASWKFPVGLYVRAGFAHHHETPGPLFLAHPVAAFAAVLPGIRHRSGFEAAVGGDFPLLSKWTDGRFGAGFDVSVTVLPDRSGPPVYVFVEQSFTVDVGKWRGKG
jgi:hypothetical protein